MAPDPRSQGLALVSALSSHPAQRGPARLVAAWRRVLATLAAWRAVEVREPAIGVDDLEWVWSTLRRKGAYKARRAP